MMDILKSEALAHDSILFRRVYFDATNDLASAIMLGQIVYWNMTDKQGKTRLRIKRNNRMWLAKRYSDWWDECRIKPRTARRCIDRLKKLGIIDVEVHKFSNIPVSHIYLNVEYLNQIIASLTSQESISGTVSDMENGVEVAKLDSLKCPDWTGESGQNGQILYTDTTSKTTSKDTAFFHAVDKFFQENSNVYYLDGKEGNHIKQLEKKLKTYEEFLSLATTFKSLTESDNEWWCRQPLVPSMMNSVLARLQTHTQLPPKESATEHYFREKRAYVAKPKPTMKDLYG